MSTPTADVVVTGLGATTPLGGDVPSTWEALLAGKSGVSTVEVDLPSGRLSVTSHQPVDEKRVRTAVVEAGYEVTHGGDS